MYQASTIPCHGETNTVIICSEEKAEVNLLPHKDTRNNFTTFKQIVARLRAPDGCPWDRKQTHTSLKPYLIEECYEVIDALDSGDSQKLREELGDLMLQVMLHSQIAAEAGEFDIEDVLRGINAKLVHRHPHVFGDTKVKDTREVLLNWERLKEEEHEEGTSILDGIPAQMPSLAAAQSMQQRAARLGFDWDNMEGVVDKLAEEMEELTDAVDHEETVIEFGDVLFTLVNVARWMGVDTEDALRQANRRFAHRFKYMEELCRQKGVSLSSLSLGEMDALWEQSKREIGDT